MIAPNEFSLSEKLEEIVCDFYDADDEEESEQRDTALSLIPDLVSGCTSGFSSADWFLFFDALGCHPGLWDDPALSAIYQQAERYWKKTDDAESSENP